MEDLPIEPGICASRIRCYTEGAMQRPAILRTGRSYRPGNGALYKSASSLHLVKKVTGEDEPSSSSQRELCKSCDQLPRGVMSSSLGRTFVSSVNIALTKPEPTRKNSLPYRTPVFHHQSDSPNVEPLSPSLSTCQVDNSDNKVNNKQVTNTSLDPPVDCLEKDTFGVNLDELELPWEINDDFPHVPVLERIKEFEKQTGGVKSRSSSPGRWKHKGKTNRNKSSGSVHSSPAISRRNSVDEKVIVRNSRNSSPAVLHLHTDSLEQESQRRAGGEACNSALSKAVTTSDLSLSNIAHGSISPPQVVLFEQESLTKSKEVQTDSILELSDSPTPDPVSEKGPSETNGARMITVSNNSLTGNKVIYSSSVISVEAKLLQERTCSELQSKPCSEQLLLEKSTESSPEVLIDPETTLCNHICLISSLSDKTELVNVPAAHIETPDIDFAIHVHDKDTDTCVSSELSFVKNANILETTAINHGFKDHQESSVLAEAFQLEPLCEDTPDQNFEEASEKLLNDSPEDCQPATNVPAQGSLGSMMDSISEVQAPSSKDEILDIQCNRPDLSECVTALNDHSQSDNSLKEPLPVQPSIDEIFQAGNSIDVYSQRCSQQLGECGSESAVLQSTSVGESLATGLLIEGSSPCLSDCYSSRSSSDDESQITDGITLSGLNKNATTDPSIKMSPQCNICSRGICIPSLSASYKEEVPIDECLDLEAAQDSKSEVMEGKVSLSDTQTEKVCSSRELITSQEETEECIRSDSDQYDSTSSSSESELSDSFDCVREVLALNQLPDLSSPLGACGGLPSPLAGAASDNAVGFSSSDKGAFSRHLSALIEEQKRGRGAGMTGDDMLNADQALFLSRVNLLLGWIHNQQSRPVPPCIQAPVPPSNVGKSHSELPSNILDLSFDVPNTNQASNSPVHKENEPPRVQYQAVQQKESKEIHVHIKPPKRSRQKKYINPDKVSHLRYLILQSPLVLSDGEDSDSDESDVELNEFGEVKQDYPLGRLPDYIVAQIFSNLGTKDLAALKCACKDFKWLIERFDIKSIDSRWSESSLYREDPCMQCGKIRDPRGDVSLCRWHPKIYYKNGEIGRHYWTCCFAGEEDAPGCETSLHDNKWSGPHSRLCKVPRSWRQYWRSYPMDS